ncbi:molecular chaperone DnaJ [Candidatus Peregrinibacteria bacterium CG11_big_fil_rev_8_21_14_0_20_46_8]|nr:MAG: molecular chaperone DnaJ [Candidatus Peregrinibacteria bacterium CG11_big_fil_rev_8_21_14_0_20_46_8]
MEKDLYKILGIERTASDSDIKRAYRKLAQKYHPDRNTGDPEAEKKFKEVNAAYEVLSDEKKRKAYDQFGSAAFQGAGGAGGFDPSGFGDFGEGFADIFETFFGGGGGFTSARGAGSRKQAGNHREIRVTISFDEAVFGTEKAIEIERIGECSACKGSGAEGSSKIITCPTCKGSGQVTSTQRTFLGNIATRRVCTTCSGAGRIPEVPCKKCRGTGTSRITEKVTIRIPGGIPPDATIRVAGKGDVGLFGGEAGDLYVHVHVQPHKKFQRQDADIFSEQKIHLLQAVLGDTIDVDTVHGSVRLKIPAGTQSSTTFKIKNKGGKKLNSDIVGDHYVLIHVEIPKKLSKREELLYRQLATESDLKLTEDKGIFKKIL